MFSFRKNWDNVSGLTPTAARIEEEKYKKKYLFIYNTYLSAVKVAVGDIGPYFTLLLFSTEKISEWKMRYW